VEFQFKVSQIKKKGQLTANASLSFKVERKKTALLRMDLSSIASTEADSGTILAHKKRVMSPELAFW